MLTCKFWYIDDGCLKKDKYSNITLWTNAFNKKQQEQILLSQLNKLGFEARLYKTKAKSGKTQWYIYIPRRNIQKFLDYIGPCPKELKNCFGYKWNYKEK
jgi:hypothetical protein